MSTEWYPRLDPQLEVKLNGEIEKLFVKENEAQKELQERRAQSIRDDFGDLALKTDGTIPKHSKILLEKKLQPQTQETLCEKLAFFLGKQGLAPKECLQKCSELNNGTWVPLRQNMPWMHRVPAPVRLHFANYATILANVILRKK